MNAFSRLRFLIESLVQPKSPLNQNEGKLKQTEGEARKTKKTIKNFYFKHN
jgi:hypothetical protein